MVTQFEEKGKIFTQRITKDQREVIIITGTHKITGIIHIQLDLRLIDELNESGHFMAITDAKIMDLNDNVLYKSNFLTINTDQIIWILPVEEIIQ
ncbi:MAG: hypothetical protein Q7U53_17650 [Anaerolineaceae bacterium]|nr:hypothetical protein [Anaerolineaceae bacterium]